MRWERVRAHVAPWVFALGLVPMATSAAAADLGRASEGFVYFHKTGSTFPEHNEAVASCVEAAANMVAPWTPGYGGIVGGVIEDAQQAKVRRVSMAANIEHCMIIKGWDVVRLPDAMGAQLAAASPMEQTAALRNWVGAAQPVGEIVRRYEPFSTLRRAGGTVYDGARESLSVSAGDYPVRAPSRPPLTEVSPVDAATVGAGATAIVVRTTSVKPPQITIWFTDANGGDDGQASMHWILQAPTPLKFMQRSRLEKTYVFLVQPGRWQIAGQFGFSTCLGGPAFDIAEGEVVFAGTFSSDGPEPLVPDLAMEPVLQSLANTAIGQRVRPARYANGSTFPCRQVPGTWLYHLELAARP